jgi:hypothetical protein
MVAAELRPRTFGRRLTAMAVGAILLAGGGFALAQSASDEPLAGQTPIPPTESDSEIVATARERVMVIQAEIESLGASDMEADLKDAAIRALEKQVTILTALIEETQSDDESAS